MRALVLLLALVAAVPAGAEVFAESAERLAGGRFDGTRLDPEGQLALAPRLITLSLDGQRDRPTQVFSVVRDASGALFLGTGPDGRVLRVDAEGRAREHAVIDEPIVSALAIAGDGRLLAGTAPGGRVLRIDADGRVEPWSETGELYVWALALGDDGRVFAGTGEHGRILELTPSGEPRVLFDADESHIVSLIAEGGDLLAGGSGRGLLYRIGRGGDAQVIFDGELAEVRGALVEPAGTIVVALQGRTAAARPRPTITLRRGAAVGGDDDPTGLEEGAAAVRGEIEGLTASPSPSRALPRGRLVRLERDGRSRLLWESDDEAPFALALDGVGRVVFGSGAPARLWRVEGDGVALLGTLDDAQVSAIAQDGRALLVATSNPASLYRLLPETVDDGSFVSAPIDAGAPARWGRIAWSASGPAGSVELATRSGMSREPDGSWSDWSPRLTLADGSRIASPDGRYLQWRARLVGAAGAARLSDVRLRYATRNRPPTLEVDDPRAAGAWTASSVSYLADVADLDGDRLEVRLEYRANGSDWTPAETREVDLSDSRTQPTEDDAAQAPPGRSRVSWSTSAMPEGRYELRMVATDQPSNPPGEGARALVALGALTVDRTPPTIEISGDAASGLRVEVGDESSPIAGLELYDGARLVATARPDDGVCDDRRERFSLPSLGSGEWRLRGIDAAGNRTDRALVPQ